MTVTETEPTARFGARIAEWWKLGGSLQVQQLVVGAVIGCGAAAVLVLGFPWLAKWSTLGLIWLLAVPWLFAPARRYAHRQVAPLPLARATGFVTNPT